jgi:hypothetical protein
MISRHIGIDEWPNLDWSRMTGKPEVENSRARRSYQRSIFARTAKSDWHYECLKKSAPDYDPPTVTKIPETEERSLR